MWLSWLGVWSEPVKRFFFVGRDMTESQRAQETLRESEQLARRIINSAIDAFVQRGPDHGDGFIGDHWSRSARAARPCWAIDREEMIGRSGADFMHPDHLENARREMRALRGGQRPTIADTRCFHKSGREVWLSWLGVWSEPVKRSSSSAAT